MQFKYPELLWALFLLLIPIIIHLFQLRRFKKTPFTNVKLLKKVLAESRRSSTIKKWLLLISRLIIFAGLVLAFAQPFFANKTALSKKETVIYLDNSFSMQAKKNEGTLLEMAVQELIKVIPKESVFSLFTNDEVFKDVSLKEVQNKLLSLRHSNIQLQLDEIDLRAQSLFTTNNNVIKNNIIISDFQQRLSVNREPINSEISTHLVQLIPDTPANIVIDTAYISKSTPNGLELMTHINGSEDLESIPVSLFNGDKLIAKTAAVFDKNNKAKVLFTLPQDEVINGKIEISDLALTYDNQLFFNLNEKEKINILVIGDASFEFLARMYSDDEFAFSSTTLKNLNYSTIEKYNFIILNEIRSFPNPLQTALKSFMANGGSITIIPAQDIDTENYNSFLANYSNTNLGESIRAEQKITGISFAHPLYQNVFEKKVTNFQYPKVMGYYRIQSRASKVLTYQDNTPFLVSANQLFLFTSPLNDNTSNFKNSPLIVPTFYAMATSSLKLPELYYTMGSITELDIPLVLSNDNILKVTKGAYEFIPQQQYFANKTSITFRENPKEDGIYTVTDKQTEVQNISFNTPREESELIYSSIENLNTGTKNNSIAQLFGEIEKDNRVTELWKWFAILALLFMLVEILIQKTFK